MICVQINRIVEHLRCDFDHVYIVVHYTFLILGVGIIVFIYTYYFVCVIDIDDLIVSISNKFYRRCGPQNPELQVIKRARAHTRKIIHGNPQREDLKSYGTAADY